VLAQNMMRFKDQGNLTQKAPAKKVRATICTQVRLAPGVNKGRSVKAILQTGSPLEVGLEESMQK
jgi:hypothetical protein